jgi:hypothetical protein
MLTVEWTAKFAEAAENFDGLVEIENNNYFFIFQRVFFPT